MKIETLYVTSDGIKFYDENEAQEHEDELNRLNTLKNKKFVLDNGKTLTHSDIVSFFNKMECSSCPFKDSCDKLYSAMRGYSTAAFQLCNVINGLKDINDEY